MKHKYRINPETLAMERVEQGIVYWLKRSGAYILGGICLGVVFFFVYSMLFPSPREKQLDMQRQNMESQLELLNHKVNQMQIIMNDIEQRDDNLYRVLLEAEPLPYSARHGAVNKMSYYDELAKMSNAQLVGDLAFKIDVLEKELYVQSKSYDEILELAKNQEIRLENIPAIQPILNKDLTRVASGFGWRMHPIYHTSKHHDGMDFTAVTGTEVYATGNATVSFVGRKQGYGNIVILDHGFGYQTYYAHLFKPLCHEGQKVKRADIIGLVGNTGQSTGPHLHYEVHYHGVPVDPTDFYFIDLTPEEYDEMIRLTNNSGQMLD